jgi:hypothetical protein
MTFISIVASDGVGKGAKHLMRGSFDATVTGLRSQSPGLSSSTTVKWRYARRLEVRESRLRLSAKSKGIWHLVDWKHCYSIGPTHFPDFISATPSSARCPLPCARSSTFSGAKSNILLKLETLDNHNQPQLCSHMEQTGYLGCCIRQSQITAHHNTRIVVKMPYETLNLSLEDAVVSGMIVNSPPNRDSFRLVVP